jgi:hypothetical protein
MRIRREFVAGAGHGLWSRLAQSELAGFYFPLCPFSRPLRLVIDDMGIGGQAKQLLHLGYEKQTKHQYP